MQPDSAHIRVEVQYAVASGLLPAREDFACWVEAVLLELGAVGEVVIRIVDEAESRQLNETYRGQTRPTNVLSFPFHAPPGVSSELLGDLAICAPVVEREALDQNKAPRAHWAHMTTHGVLHLLGFDHQADAQAEEMEALETRILVGLGFPPPYESGA